MAMHIACGINYLHANKVVHLDIKVWQQMIPSMHLRLVCGLNMYMGLPTRTCMMNGSESHHICLELHSQHCHNRNPASSWPRRMMSMESPELLPK